jgi:hypothetical protein
MQHSALAGVFSSVMRRSHIGLLLILIACALSAVPSAQNPQRAGEGAPTGLLMGVIIDPLDTQPVPNAEVKLGGAPPGTPNTVVLADDEGRFVFMGLPKGSFTITATKPGYADGAYGRLRPMGLPQALTLGEGERLGDLRIPVWKFAAVTGRVTDEAGEPVIGVAVRALQRTIVAGKQKLAPGPTARTDDRGVYRIPSLTPGEYAVVVPSTQASAPDAVIDLFLQQRMTPGASKPGESDIGRDLSFSGATEALLVIDRHRGTRVGAQSFVSVGAGSRAAVAPALSAGGRIHVYPTQYHPAAPTAAGASILTLRSGEERGAIDIQLALAATSIVSGNVKGPDGPLMAVLSLVPDSDDLSIDTGFETATTLSDAAGRFTFVGVPEGRYRMRAILAQVPISGGMSRGAPPPPPQGLSAPSTPPLPALGGFTLWATQSIAVGASDINDLAVNLRAGFRIGGRSEFVGALAQPAPDVVRRMSATFDPADARPLVSITIGRGQFDERGRLSSYQLPPGRYYVRVNNAPVGWMLKSAMLNGRDVSNVPLSLDADVTALVMTFTDRPSTVSGQVQNATGASDPSATVLVFPADPGAWTDYGDFPRRLRAIRVDRNGQFQTANLAPGDYLLVAIPEDSSANWQDPKVLQALARLGTSITLGDGETRSATLKTSVVAR